MTKILVQRIENLAELEDLVAQALSTCNILRLQIEQLRNFQIRIQTREMEITHTDTQAGEEKC